MDNFFRSMESAMIEKTEKVKNQNSSFEDSSPIQYVVAIEEQWEREGEEDTKIWSVLINNKKLTTVYSEAMALSIIRNFASKDLI